MKILEVTDRTLDLINQLLEVWEKSVSCLLYTSIRRGFLRLERTSQSAEKEIRRGDHHLGGLPAMAEGVIKRREPVTLPAPYALLILLPAASAHVPVSYTHLAHRCR